MEILHLSSILHFTAFMLFFAMGISVISMKNMNMERWMLSGTLISVSLWAVVKMTVENPATSHGTASFVFENGLIFRNIPPLFLMYFSLLTFSPSVKIRNPLIPLILLLTAAVFTYYAVSMKMFVLELSPNGWLQKKSPEYLPLITAMFYVPLTVFIGINTVMVFSKNPLRKATGILLCVSMLMAVVLDFVLKPGSLLNNSIDYIGMPVLISLFIAIKRYWMFGFGDNSMETTDAEERFRRIFEKANDGIFTMKEDRIIEANQKAAELFGYQNPVQLVGLSVIDLSPEFQPDGMASGDKAFMLIEKVMKGEPQRFIWKHKKKDNSIFHAEVSLSFVELKSGKFLQAMVRDITERIKSEEIQKKSFESMKELSMLKTNFISMVSHELRTPLTAISGFADIIASGRAGALTGEQKEYIEIIKNNTKRQAQLIKSLLDMTAMETGGFSVNAKEADLSAAADHAADEMKNKADKKSISFRKKYSGQNPAVFDEARIKQVIVNVLDNAVKFSPENTEIEITIVQAGPHEIAESPARLQGVKKALILTVKDSGIGIDAEYIDRIFGHFYQAGSETSLVNKGAGLGLYIAEKIIEAHGGFMWAKSEGRGRGTCVNFMIPVN